MKKIAKINKTFKGEREPMDEEMKEEEDGSEPDAEADPDEEMESPAPEPDGQQQPKEEEVEAGPTPLKLAKKSDKYCDKCEREMCSRQFFI